MLAAPVPALIAVECTARRKKKRRSGRQPRQQRQKFVQVTRHSPPFSNKCVRCYDCNRTRSVSPTTDSVS